MYIIFIALILLKIKNITTNIPNGIIRFFEKTINNSMFNLKNIKMKVLKFLSFAVLLVALASCGGNGDENSVTLKVEAELGPLADYVKVLDQEVVVKMSDVKEDSVDYKLIQSSIAFEVIKSVASDYGFYFIVEVLDKDHVHIATLPIFDIEPIYDLDNGDLSHILSAGSVRAQMESKREVAGITPEDQEVWNKILKEGAYFLIRPSYSNAKYEEYKGKSSNAEVVESSNDTITKDEDLDAVLNSYEE